MDINDFDLGHYEIHGMYSYFQLQEIAEKKMLYSVYKLIHSYIVFVLCIVCVFLLFAFLSFLTRESSAVNSLINVAYLLVCGFALGCGIVGTFDTFKKIARLNVTYKADMRTIREKLEKCMIYMEIPDEDYNKFDSPLKIIRYYRKHKDDYNFDTVTDYAQQREK